MRIVLRNYSYKLKKSDGSIVEIVEIVDENLTIKT